uniref:Uncharacterized protein n=1 Tax=Cucumis sativus TaxID=3659 RepID=A0A0A0K4W5_CUCSA
MEGVNYDLAGKRRCNDLLRRHEEIALPPRLKLKVVRLARVSARVLERLSARGSRTAYTETAPCTWLPYGLHGTGSMSVARVRLTRNWLGERGARTAHTEWLGCAWLAYDLNETGSVHVAHVRLTRNWLGERGAPTAHTEVARLRMARVRLARNWLGEGKTAPLREKGSSDGGLMRRTEVGDLRAA